MDILEGLNESQAYAVTAESRHLLIVAGPGTGKTTTMVRRIGLLLENKVPPDKILAITFTNRAAREMRERVFALLGEGAAKVFVATFHLLGTRMIRSMAAGDFTVCTRDDQLGTLRAIVGTVKDARDSADRISRFKNETGPLDDAVKPLYESYNAALAARGMYDFDDLIRVPLKMMEAGSSPLPEWSRFIHIIVDEYQDVAPAQARLLHLLAKRADAAVCAVGDADQAIYGFRGANMESFLHFQTYYPDVQVVALEESYRSSGVIAAAANGVIRNNEHRIEKNIKPRREPGGPVTVIAVDDEKMEARVIAREIEARVGGTSHFRLSGIKTSVDFSPATCAFSDFAVFFRTNAQARLLHEVLSESGIPCQTIGEKQSKGVGLVVAALRRHLDLELAAEAPLVHVLEQAKEKINLRQSEEDYLFSLALAYGHLPAREAISTIIDELSLFGDSDAFDPRADAVTLMTLHSAKGLEFTTAFIAGVEEGLLPFTLLHETADVEEERRLFFVGMTRAMDNLFLLHAKSRFLYGEQRFLPPSRFLSEIPRELTRTETIASRNKGRKQGRQTSLF